MSRYRLTPRARAGLESILAYVQDRFGDDVAERVLDDLEAAFERLADHPGIGRKRPDITSDERVRF